MDYVLRGLVHCHYGVIWWCAGWHGAGDEAEIPSAWSTGIRKWSVALGLAWAYMKPQSLSLQIFVYCFKVYCNALTEVHVEVNSFFPSLLTSSPRITC